MSGAVSSMGWLSFCISRLSLSGRWSSSILSQINVAHGLRQMSAQRRDELLGRPREAAVGQMQHSVAVHHARRQRPRVEIAAPGAAPRQRVQDGDRSEEHTSELQALMRLSYAGFCLKKKRKEHRLNQ